MAERRMFTKKITESDAFLDMPLSTQALYFHLNMAADDEGFVNNSKRIQRTIGATDDDMRLLFAKNFIIPFETGVIVIKHWKMHNYIQKDRFHRTDYQDEKKLLTVKKNGSYTLTDTECIQDVYKMDTEVRLGKDSLGKDSNTCAFDDKSTNEKVNELFEILWKQYPFRKRGKGQVSLTKRKVLYRIGQEQMERCIKRFQEDMKGKDEQYIMIGSTFFNSGYVDYLDENVEKPEIHKEPEEEHLNFWDDE